MLSLRKKVKTIDREINIISINININILFDLDKLLIIVFIYKYTINTFFIVNREGFLSKKYKFLHNFFKIIEELNIEYWLEGGTALSAYRDGEIFPWEHDCDIGVLKKNLDNKLRILIEKISEIDSVVIVQKNFHFWII